MLSEANVVTIVTALLGAGAAAPVVVLGRWIQRTLHARTPEGRAEATRMREQERQAEHWATHERSVSALARTRDELIEDLGRIRADRDRQAEEHRADRLAWQTERASLVEQHRAERESWAAERARILAEVDHWETRFRQVLTEFETWKRTNGYPPLQEDRPAHAN